MKLAHFSDIHVTRFPLSQGFALKRLAAVASFTGMGRGRDFAGSDERIAKLLSDVDELGVDHALCTGDLTGVSGDEELTRCAQLFGHRLREPSRFTVIPGNHDRYVSSQAGAFEKHFGALCEGGRFPFVKRLGPGVTLVAIDVCRPTSLVDSSGLVGKAQLDALAQILTDRSLSTQFVVLALHYGLLRSDGSRDKRSHGMRDDLALMALVDRADVTVDVVLHGHMHRPYSVRTARRTVFNAGSGTDLHVACGYNVYTVDAERFTLRCERRAWSRVTQRYEAAPESPLNLQVRTREPD